MPTYGYLYDRFHEHQASLDEAETSGAALSAASCPVCGWSTDSWQEIGEHLRTEHPLGAPQLLVNGRPCASDKAVRRPLSAGAVCVMNTTTIDFSVDGGPSTSVDAAEVGEALAAVGTGHVQLVLHNERADGASAARAVVFDIRLADVRDLDAVESAFDETVSRRLTPSEADSFAERSLTATTAHSYAGALHKFLIALLQKDGRIGGSGLELSKYPARMNEALHELSQYPDRPLARAAAGVIRFNINLFGGLASGIPELDRCVEQLTRSSSDLDTNHPERLPSELKSCPVDDATDAILQASADLDEPRRSRAACTQLVRFASAVDTAPADAVKARALVLLASPESASDEYRHAAEALVHDPTFGGLAETRLRSFGKLSR